ncbi:MAG TPA: hypothetical protein VFU37_15960 [Pyrinomonadaceae bacterium]|nr:hypothetical protein [Pyrinomonadaceae bacterium]
MTPSEPTNKWTRADRLLGIWSAIAVVFLSVAYIITGAIWLISNARVAQERGLEPSEPFLSILETLLLLSTPAIVTLFATIHAYAPTNRKTCSLAAFGFALLLSGITGTIHFVRLTAIRLISGNANVEVFALYDPHGRLTPALSADLVAWDFFFGFALLFAATIFRGDKLQLAIRAALATASVLCLMGIAGPASGNLKFQYPAIVGYAFVFPFVCLLLAIFFARSQTVNESA